VDSASERFLLERKDGIYLTGPDGKFGPLVSSVQLRDLPAPVQETLSRVRMRGMPGTLQDMERARILGALQEAGVNLALKLREAKIL